MQILYFFLNKILKLWHITAFLPLTITKLSTLNNSLGFFGPPCICMINAVIKNQPNLWKKIWKVKGSLHSTFIAAISDLLEI